MQEESAVVPLHGPDPTHTPRAFMLETERSDGPTASRLVLHPGRERHHRRMSKRPSSEQRGEWDRWHLGLCVVAVVLFSVALVVRLSCSSYGCVGSRAESILNLDEIGGLPRLFTTGVLLAIAVIAFLGSRQAEGVERAWWSLIALVGLGLTVAKMFSLHSVEKAAHPVTTMVISTMIAAVTLTILWRTGLAWGISARVAVLVALGFYAAAALGLDVVTAALARLDGPMRASAVAVGTFVEEFAEAITALFVLKAVRANRPREPSGSGDGAAQEPRDVPMGSQRESAAPPGPRSSGQRRRWA
jgi:hypothetical protein